MLHHDKLKITRTAKLGIRLPKQAPPEKNDKCGKGSVVPKTDIPIDALFMGNWSRTQVAPETSQQLQAPVSQG